jgi:hypothetical protein
VSSHSGTVLLEVELIVHAVVGIPPFASIDRESDTHHELFLVDLPPVVL